jgi:hypothetical protein
VMKSRRLIELPFSPRRTAYHISNPEWCSYAPRQNRLLDFRLELKAGIATD